MVIFPCVSASPDSSLGGPCIGRSGHTRTASNGRCMARPVDLNDGINVFPADKTPPPLYHAGTPQFLQLSANHEPLAAWTRHRHRIYCSFLQISTMAWPLPSCGLIICSIPSCSGARLNNVAKSSSYAFSLMVVLHGPDGIRDPIAPSNRGQTRYLYGAAETGESVAQGGKQTRERTRTVGVAQYRIGPH
jgi:hypothetical protein